jgi:hypothetical protein
MVWKIGRISPAWTIWLAGSGSYATKEDAETALVGLVLQGISDTGLFSAVEVPDDIETNFNPAYVEAKIVPKEKQDDGVQLVLGPGVQGQGSGVVPPDDLGHGLVQGGEVQAPDRSKDGA